MLTPTASNCLNEAEIILSRMEDFHRKRVEAIQNDESRVSSRDPSRFVVHLLPEEAVRSPKSLPAADLKRASRFIDPLRSEHNGSYSYNRFNADGFMLYNGQDVVKGYSQLHRNGVLEGVMTDAFYHLEERKIKVLREDWCEDALLDAPKGYLLFAKALSFEPPFWMFSALIGCEGARICTDRNFRDCSKYAIDRSVVWLPQIKIEDFDINLTSLLRPVCDVLWNAVGIEKSGGFDEKGARTVRR